jgi:hypothetical protein
MKPTVKTKCVAAEYAAPNERIIEIHDHATKKGCLVSIRVVQGDLVIEVYRGDDGVIVRSNGHDIRVPK